MVFQRSGESLKDYIERFRCKVNNVESPFDKSILTAISVGLRKDGKLYKSIYKSPVRDLGEFYERAAKEVRWGEAFGLKKSSDQKNEGEHTGQNKKRGDEDTNKGGRGRSPNDQTAKKARYGREVERLARQGRYESYSVLSDSQDRIFATECNKEDFGRPNPLRTPDKYRSKRKLCSYHNEAGHTTSECWALKDAIEELIRRGTSNRSHERYVREAIHLLLVGDDSHGGHSKKAKMASDDISLTKNDSKDVYWLHNDALVVRAWIGNMEVRRIIVDTGS
ncbi:uncharacterized protein LOC127787548 [Diospyros lotus]|uniref:uncharacterized protein LOC127787548 n=1 Tax=Diospyros lotus TaxID=55363 RepID=UPI0022567714|nr:uncharacterized protein LOC127787548 [Diospyros lotus]